MFLRNFVDEQKPVEMFSRKMILIVVVVNLFAIFPPYDFGWWPWDRRKASGNATREYNDMRRAISLYQLIPKRRSFVTLRGKGSTPGRIDDDFDLL